MWFGWDIGMWIGFLLVFLIFFGIWLSQIIRLCKRKEKTSMWVVLILGLIFSPFLGGLVGLFLGRDREE